MTTHPHENGTKHEHHEEVGRPIAERALLQRPAVAVREDHVEEETEAERAEEAEARDQTPELIVHEDECWIVVELEGRE